MYNKECAIQYTAKDSDMRAIGTLANRRESKTDGRLSADRLRFLSLAAELSSSKNRPPAQGATVSFDVAEIEGTFKLAHLAVRAI